MAASTAPASNITHKLQHAAQLLQQGQAESAKGILLPLVAKNGQSGPLMRLLRQTMSQLGLHEQGLYYAQRAQKLEPDNPDALNLLGNSLVDLGRLEEAETTLRSAVEKEPRHGPNAASLARVLSIQGRHAEAEEAGAKAAALLPHNFALLNIRMMALLNTARADQAISMLQGACAAEPGNPYLLSMLCSAMLFGSRVSPLDMHATYRAFGRLCTQAMPKRIEHRAEKFAADRKLKLALIGTEFRTSALSPYLEPLIEHLSRSQFDLFVMHHAPSEDETSARIKALPGVTWFNTSRLAPAAMAELIASHGVDVAVDLIGHLSTPPLLALHLKPAPLQISWLGQPLGPGLEMIDYRLTDAHQDPEGCEAETLGVERLTRLSRPASYRVPKDLVPSMTVASSRAESPGQVTFGGITVGAKLNEPSMRRWISAMRLVPGSRLLLRHYGLTSEQDRAYWKSRLSALGIDAARVELLPAGADRAAHVQTYEHIDVVLDTAPFGMGPSIPEALAMGVPVITLAGSLRSGSHSRASSGVLSALGLSEFIAADDDAFAHAAAKLAQDTAKRTALKSELPARVKRELGNEGAFASAFGDKIRELWRAACAAPRP